MNDQYQSNKESMHVQNKMDRSMMNNQYQCTQFS
jgi:hypothetical protein